MIIYVKIKWGFALFFLNLLNMFWGDDPDGF